jgi:flap endonuclease-1
MGTAITSLLVSEKTKIENFQGKILAVDTFNILYQFLSTIRQADGTPLKDSKGRITSHLTGLFFRTTNLMEKGIKLVFVFDGKVPELKNAERERRKAVKIEAQKEYEKAAAEEDIAGMKKFAQRTSLLTPEMVEQSKKMIEYLGLPVVLAASEGEAQAAYLVKKGDAYAVASQDSDSLIFGAIRVVKNLAVTGRKKVSGKFAYEPVQPELINLKDNLSNLNISQDQLIALAMLVGTDYNIGGIKGIGPKKALDLVKKHGDNLEEIFKEAKWSENFSFSWQEVFSVIKDIKVNDEYFIRFERIQRDKLIELLVGEHGFSLERVNSALDKLEKRTEKQAQKGLSDFF